MMKAYLLKLLILLLVVFSLVSCNDPIFYMVTQETKLIPPRIGGSPTNFVEYNEKIYVASGKKLFSYGNNEWSKETLDAFVLKLAATENSLYTLYLSGDSGKIKRYYNGDNSSEEVNMSGNVQSIYASGNVLFICVRNNNNKYTIHYLDEDDPNFNIKEIAGTDSDYILNGAASDSNYYYLSAYSGIFYVEKDKIDSPSDLNVLKNEEDKKYTGFTGIIKLNSDYIAAITISGDLYEITGAVITKRASFNDSRDSTGALAIWKNKDDPTKKLLLVGRKEYYYSTTTAYSNGYVEIELDETGRIKIVLDETGKEIQRFREPGKTAPTTIDNYDRYVSSLGKKTINHIIQAPTAAIDENMTLFASTQKDGVWSYRIRDGYWQWNAEQ